jgi:hypothetical protein
VVLLVSDCIVADLEPVLALARSATTHTRLFVLGVGSNPNRHAAAALGRAGGGACEIVAHTQDGRLGVRGYGAVRRQIDRCLTASTSGVSVGWSDGAIAAHVPRHLPAAFPGDCFRVYRLDAEGVFWTGEVFGPAPAHVCGLREMEL